MARDRKLDEEIRRAMLEMGWIFPTSIEDVEIVERALASRSPVELPEALRNPDFDELLRRYGEN